MLIEEKNLSPTETILFFSAPLAIQGAFLYTPSEADSLSVLDNISKTTLANTLLLTNDFIYIKSTDQATHEDLKALTLAEIDDFSNQPTTTYYAPEEYLISKIKIILKTIIAPFLQKDGGDIELVEYDKGIAKVHFLGKCQGCPYAQKTLKNRVEKNLIHYLPQIREAVLI